MIFNRTLAGITMILILASAKTQKSLPSSFWLGWWSDDVGPSDRKTDRLQISQTPEAGTLYVSGRIYWYGLDKNVHSIDVTEYAYPDGNQLHLKGKMGATSCSIDLNANQATQTFSAGDNQNCGGMDTHLMGTWKRFTAKSQP